MTVTLTVARLVLHLILNADLRVGGTELVLAVNGATLTIFAVYARYRRVLTWRAPIWLPLVAF